jgi:hypothetical protein
MDTQTLTEVVGRYQAETVQVQYQDVANLLRVGTVVEHIAGEFRVCWDDAEGGETWSDLRQCGWQLATEGSLAMLAWQAWS